MKYIKCVRVVAKVGMADAFLPMGRPTAFQILRQKGVVLPSVDILERNISSLTYQIRYRVRASESSILGYVASTHWVIHLGYLNQEFADYQWQRHGEVSI